MARKLKGADQDVADLSTAEALARNRSVIDHNDQRFAMKAVVLYLEDILGFDTNALATIIDTEFSLGTPALNPLQRLVRKGGTGNFAAGELDDLADALQSFIMARRITVPFYIDRVFEVARVRKVDRDGIPNFIDPLGLFQSREEYNVDEILAVHGGCYDVYRVASPSDDHAGVRISRSFLNITPREVLRRTRRSVAEFSLYQNDDRETGGKIKLTGIVAHTDNVVTLIGEKKLDDKFSRKIGNVAVLTWPYPDREAVRGQKPDLKGLALVPNSKGNVVSTNFVAFHIEGTANLNKEQYEQLRNQRRDAVATLSLDELELTETHRNEIDELILLSRERMVFQIGAGDRR